VVRNHEGGTRCAVLADCTQRVTLVTWEWAEQEESEEGNHSTESEGDVLRKYILDAEMFDRGKGKDQEGRQPTMCKHRGERTRKTLKTPSVTAKVKRGVAKTTERLRVLLGAGPTACGRGRHHGLGGSRPLDRNGRFSDRPHL